MCVCVRGGALAQAQSIVSQAATGCGVELGPGAGAGAAVPSACRTPDASRVAAEVACSGPWSFPTSFFDCALFCFSFCCCCQRGREGESDTQCRDTQKHNGQFNWKWNACVSVSPPAHGGGARVCECVCVQQLVASQRSVSVAWKFLHSLVHKTLEAEPWLRLQQQRLRYACCSSAAAAVESWLQPAAASGQHLINFPLCFIAKTLWFTFVSLYLSSRCAVFVAVNSIGACYTPATCHKVGHSCLIAYLPAFTFNYRIYRITSRTHLQKREKQRNILMMIV